MNCIDCNAEISPRSTRCNPCSGILRRRQAHGKTITSKGYVLLTGMHGTPGANHRGQIKEHIYVMSKALGRQLESHESVHHKNANRQDNRLENLELWSKSQPTGARATDLVTWAKEILEAYEWMVEKESDE